MRQAVKALCPTTCPVVKSATAAILDALAWLPRHSVNHKSVPSMDYINVLFMVLLTSQKVAQNIIYHSEPSVGKF